VTGRYAAAVYPYLSLEPVDRGDAEQVLALLAELHAASGAAGAAVRRDDLALQGRAGLERVLGRLGEPWRSGPFAEPARAALATHAGDLAALLGTYDAAAREVGADRSGWVVTHGEPKPGNLMRHGGRVVLLDWDTALLAPAARDVWMLEDWLAGPEPGAPPGSGQDAGDGAVARRYAEVTGRGIPQRELTLFRLRWDLTDIALFAADLAAPHERTADTEVAWGALEAGLRGLPRWRRALAG
jgi:spectinomycin phosphotransferase